MLVYPDQAEVAAGRISVLTPVGAALIGLSKNQSIDWETPARERRSLTVLSVQQPVAARQIAARKGGPMGRKSMR